jgi:hypothetical protein
MKKYTLEQKMQVCLNCPHRKKGTLFIGEEYCKEVGETIAQIASCRAWESFWEFGNNFEWKSGSGK